MPTPKIRSDSPDASLLLFRAPFAAHLSHVMCGVLDHPPVASSGVTLDLIAEPPWINLSPSFSPHVEAPNPSTEDRRDSTA